MSVDAALAFDVTLPAGARTFHHRATMAAPGTLVVFGPSAAGKTLTLRALAGLVRPAAGRIAQHGRVLFDAEERVWVPPQQRRVGYVPQHAAVFPHLTVRENVAFGVPRAARATRVAEVLAQLELTALADRDPAALSGGERQRVAIARALAPRPETLLLDEPFSALDAPARAELRAWLHAHVRGLVVVLVTHDREEAELLGDHCVLVRDGRTVAEGPPAAVLR